MQNFIKKQSKAKTFTFSQSKLFFSIFSVFLLNIVFVSNIRAGICLAPTSTAFINCLSSIATTGDTIKLTGTFTLPASVSVPNKNFVLDPSSFDIITGGTTFNPTGNPTWTVINSPDVIIVKQSAQQPFNNFTYLTSKGSLSAFLGFIKNGPTLPIEFQSFDAYLTQQGVQLSWLVAQDNATEFVVERRSNGKEYETIGTIHVRDYIYSSTPLYYTFKDQKPIGSSAYYRIKSIDLGGKTVYSKTITVANDKKVGYVKIYPNPVGLNDNLNIETDSDIQKIVITNSLGQVVMVSKLLTINTTELSAGVYHISVKTNDETVIKRFIKQ